MMEHLLRARSRAREWFKTSAESGPERAARLWDEESAIIAYQTGHNDAAPPWDLQVTKIDGNGRARNHFGRDEDPIEVRGPSTRRMVKDYARRHDWTVLPIDESFYVDVYQDR